MFDRRFAFTGAAVILVTAFSLFVASKTDAPEIAPIAETIPGVERASEESAPGDVGYAYLIKEHNGRVAVYPANSSEPELVLDVLVKYLPDYDQSQMALGIKVKDYDDLIRLIEDYTS